MSSDARAEGPVSDGSARRGNEPWARGYRALVIADEQTSGAVQALIDQTYAAMSTPGSDVADLFGTADIAIAGSGQGELWTGHE